MIDFKGAWCVVLGSAPLTAPLIVDAKELIVAVNGGIYHWPMCDVWVLNARTATDPATIGRKRGLNRIMLEQGAGRTLDHLVLLEKAEGDGERHTLEKLRRQHTRWHTVGRYTNEQRRALETAVGARSAEMTKQALSAGLFAAAWCFYHGADRVRLEGFSWSPGYAYPLEGEAAPVARGHEAGDKQAIARLEARYPGRLIHSLRGAETTMAKTPLKPAAKPVPAAERARTAATPGKAQAVPGATRAAAPIPGARIQRPTPDSRARNREGMRDARANLTPAAERAGKVDRAREARNAPKGETGKPLVRATATCFYNNKRQRPGSTFELRDKTHFKESCMEWADPNDPTGDGNVGDQAEPRRVGALRHTPPLSGRPTLPGGEGVDPGQKVSEAVDDPLNVG